MNLSTAGQKRFTARNLVLFSLKQKQNKTSLSGFAYFFIEVEYQWTIVGKPSMAAEK